jgi:hypothetical protein
MHCYVRIIRCSEVPGAAIRIENKPIGDVTAADIKTVRRARLAAAEKAKAARIASEAETPDAPKGRTWEKSGHVGVNRLLARWRHIFNWALSEGHIKRTPFRRDGATVVTLNRAAETRAIAGCKATATT